MAKRKSKEEGKELVETTAEAQKITTPKTDKKKKCGIIMPISSMDSYSSEPPTTPCPYNQITF